MPARTLCSTDSRRPFRLQHRPSCRIELRTRAIRAHSQEFAWASTYASGLTREVVLNSWRRVATFAQRAICYAASSGAAYGIAGAVAINDMQQEIERGAGVLLFVVFRAQCAGPQPLGGDIARVHAHALRHVVWSDDPIFPAGVLPLSMT